MAYGFNLTYSADTTNVAVDLSDAGALRLGAVHMYNPNAAAVFVQFFPKTAANTTVGTTVPVVSLGVGPGATLSLNFQAGWKIGGVACCVAVTNTATGNGAPATAPRLTVVHGGA